MSFLANQARRGVRWYDSSVVQPGAGLTLVTPAAGLAVTLADAKLQQRIDQSAEDSLITDWINAATAWVENITDYSLLTQTWKQSVDREPAGGTRPIYLARKPLISVTSIDYTDTEGNPQTFTDFQADDQSETPRVAPDVGEVWPSVQVGKLGGLSITYQAGFGPDETTVPIDFKNAILLLVGHFYRNREAVTSGPSNQVEMTARAILAQRIGRDERVRT
ncbi:MAG: hypothetical protein GTO41_20040 [Burkholderiales bacterium]|nr:hypothetical protein [Burkholderiales bacterium]